MENPSSSFEEFGCPILCITKSVLFILITAFVLYLPFGEPEGSTERTTYPWSHQRKDVAVCCICDVYKLLATIIEHTSEFIDALYCSVKDFLYDTKLKFYALLAEVDRIDVCTVMQCCSDCNAKQDPNIVSEPRVRSCRCHKKRSCKKL